MKKTIYEHHDVYGSSRDFTNTTSNRLQKLHQILKNKNSKLPTAVLDIGCGTGYLADQIKSLFPNARVVGVDISSAALIKARKSYKNIEFVLGDAAKELAFPKDTFDLVISGENIEHIVDTDTYLRNINKVTKVGGRLILTTPNLGSWMNRLLLLFGKQPYYLEASFSSTLPIFSIGSFTFPDNLDYPAAGHLRLFTLNILKKLLTLHGFKTIEAQGYTMLEKPLLKHLDNLFARIPSMAFGLIVVSEKSKSI